MTKGNPGVGVVFINALNPNVKIYSPAELDDSGIALSDWVSRMQEKVTWTRYADYAFVDLRHINPKMRCTL